MSVFLCLLGLLPVNAPAVAAPHVAASWLGPAADELGDLADDLKNPEPKPRRAAVIALGKLGTLEALALVVKEALTDRAPRVADEAQIVLANARYGDALGKILGSRDGLRAKLPLVRLRVVEVLGRMGGEVPGEVLQKALTDKEPDVRAAAAFALELRARAGAGALALDAKSASALGKALLKAATKDKEPRVRGNAMLALAALAPALAPLTDVLGADAAKLDGAVLGALGSGPTLARVAARRVQIERGHVDRAGLLRDLAGEVRPIATEAVAHLVDIGDKAAMVALASRLDPESKVGLPPALAERIVGALRAASGLSHGLQHERWSRWAQGLADDWRVSEDESAGTGEEELRSTSFFGLRLATDRVAFLVDMSGSMWSDRKGPPRKESVDVELQKALEGLDPEAYFNVVPYAGNPAPWKGKLTRATPKNVGGAISSFRGSGLRGQGDVWSALVPVLRDPEVDTVVILTDGAPTGGDRWNVKLMRKLLADENRLRGITLHVILFDASRTLQGYWKDVAEDSGGVMHLID